jgi:hypothetical protein
LGEHVVDGDAHSWNRPRLKAQPFIGVTRLFQKDEHHANERALGEIYELVGLGLDGQIRFDASIEMSNFRHMAQLGQCERTTLHFIIFCNSPRGWIPLWLHGFF